MTTLPPLPVLPDIEAVLQSWCLGDPRLEAVIGVNVGGELPAKAKATDPWLIVQRLGGTPTRREWLDRALIQIDAWAGTKVTASLVARTARASIHSMPYGVVHGAVVTGVEDIVGVMWFPDRDRTPPSPRYTCRLAITFHP